MIIDAIVLAGGRASRLGGASKPALRYGERTLLEAAIAACGSARQVAVVGAESDISAAAPGADILITREQPAFGGPASAIAAGVNRLAASDPLVADFTLVLACDMPRVAEVVAALRSALRAGSDGVVAVTPDGTVQQLSAVYSTRRLAECVAEHLTARDLDGLSVRALVSGLNPDRVSVEPGTTDDVDTWLDAERLGVVAATHPSNQEHPMADKPVAHDDDAILEEWCAALLEQLGLDDVSVDIDGVLGLAGVVAHAVVRPAAPLTAFVVGYSAARVAERTGVSVAEAFSAASSAAKELARSGTFGPVEH